VQAARSAPELAEQAGSAGGDIAEFSVKSSRSEGPPGGYDLAIALYARAPEARSMRCSTSSRKRDWNEAPHACSS
jgi:hypothetical protein